MISLAAIRYRNILTKNGGPISRISSRILSGKTPISGQQYEVYAYLNNGLDLLRPWSPSLYGKAEGTGTDTNKMLAVHKAISEALERWAYLTHYKSEKLGNYGFDINPSSAGMAAYPSLTSGSARILAFEEAVERWSLSAWWEGLLKAESSKLNISDQERTTLCIRLPWMKKKFVILHHQRTLKSGLGCYGFACGSNLKLTSIRAEIELLRNERTLDNISERIETIDQSKLSLLERRLLFFASNKGIQVFSKRLAKQERKLLTDAPSLVVDKEIPGSWTKYAFVWRCLLQPISNEFLKDTPDYFLF